MASIKRTVSTSVAFLDTVWQLRPPERPVIKVYINPRTTIISILWSGGRLLMLLTRTSTTADISIGPIRSFRDFVLLALR
jgi:hypothetical protein